MERFSKSLKEMSGKLKKKIKDLLIEVTDEKWLHIAMGEYEALRDLGTLSEEIENVEKDVKKFKEYQTILEIPLPEYFLEYDELKEQIYLRFLLWNSK